MVTVNNVDYNQVYYLEFDLKKIITLLHFAVITFHGRVITFCENVITFRVSRFYYILRKSYYTSRIYYILRKWYYISRRLLHLASVFHLAV